jgi:radical SAM protein with 4Fe4S-binding SPASM domain
MHKDIIKIEPRQGKFLIFSKEGMLLSLEKHEFEIFNTLGKEKKLPEEHKDFLRQLVSYGILEFEDFKLEKPIQKEYDTSLMRHNSDKPIYTAPVLAHLAVTDKCNMACKYCSVRKLHQACHCQNELSTEEWKKIINDLADWGVFQIGFTGGEPTLRKDLPELVRFTHEKGCVCNLTTNGWFLDEKLVEELADAGMKQCQVSLDSHIPEVHDRLRGQGSWKRVIKAVELMKEKGISVGIDCVLSKNNIKTIPGLIEWMTQQQIPYLTIIKLKKGDLSEQDFEELKPDYHEYSKIIKDICKRKINEKPNITLDCGSVAHLQIVADKDKLSNLPIAGCPIGHHLICSSPNGDIYPCASLLDKRFCLGNLLTDDLKDIWNNNRVLKEFRLIKQKVEGKCKNCDRLDLCRGGCRGIAYSLTKKLFDSDPTCQYQEVQNGDNCR